MEGPEIKAVEAVIDNGSFGKRTLRFETGRLAQQAQMPSRHTVNGRVGRCGIGHRASLTGGFARYHRQLVPIPPRNLDDRLRFAYLPQRSDAFQAA